MQFNKAEFAKSIFVSRAERRMDTMNASGMSMTMKAVACVSVVQSSVLRETDEMRSASATVSYASSVQAE